MIIVEKSEEPAYRRPQKGFKALAGLHIPKDLLVYTLEEFRSSIQHPSSLFHEVFHKGKLLYEAA